MIRALHRLLFVIYFLETGLLLIVVPWSTFWERNFFTEQLPAVRALLNNAFVRGAVSGIGLVNLFAGLSDLASILIARRSTVLSVTQGFSARNNPADGTQS